MSSKVNLINEKIYLFVMALIKFNILSMYSYIFPLLVLIAGILNVVTDLVILAMLKSVLIVTFAMGGKRERVYMIVPALSESFVPPMLFELAQLQMGVSSTPNTGKAWLTDKVSTDKPNNCNEGSPKGITIPDSIKVSRYNPKGDKWIRGDDKVNDRCLWGTLEDFTNYNILIGLEASDNRKQALSEAPN
ncbi:hypothetical protein B0I35DRAFT_505314 [Stachybotrys elegans]|uniref:Uncharacterized protein n=1 Tax=Stachybotrys elegans TaxID=80388 RepID=A0A8K0WQ08_9HYPO|nr:hypothetical protein B0I35DRAFT_505314 [Stachybotrys elegans]